MDSGSGVTVGYSVRMSDLRELSKEERSAAIDKLVDAAYGPPNGLLEDLEARIRKFEFRYETSSERMRKELLEGERKETADIASWLMLLRLRENIGLREPTSSKSSVRDVTGQGCN